MCAIFFLRELNLLVLILQQQHKRFIIDVFLINYYFRNLFWVFYEHFSYIFYKNISYRCSFFDVFSILWPHAINLSNKFKKTLNKFYAYRTTLSKVIVKKHWKANDKIPKSNILTFAYYRKICKFQKKLLNLIKIALENS